MFSVRRYSLPPMKIDSLGQLIMTGVPGKELDLKTVKLFRKVKPGAFILFGRNIESASQLRKLIDDLRDLSAIEPIITAPVRLAGLSDITNRIELEFVMFT